MEAQQTSGAGHVVRAEGLPDDVLADVGRDEQADAGPQAVAVLQELVQADDDDAREEQLRGQATQGQRSLKRKNPAGEKPRVSNRVPRKAPAATCNDERSCCVLRVWPGGHWRPPQHLTHCEQSILASRERVLDDQHTQLS